jgi:uncharacterized protein
MTGISRSGWSWTFCNRSGDLSFDVAEPQAPQDGRGRRPPHGQFESTRRFRHDLPVQSAAMGRARIFLAIFLFAAVGLRAEPVSRLHPSNYVNDFVHVLSQQTVSELNDICQQLDQKAHAQVAVVTINSTDGKDIFDYAVDLYQAWGIGSKSTDRGILIIFAIKDHKYGASTGYGLEPILPDGKIGGFRREVLPLLKNDDYNGAVRLMTLRVADVIAKDAGIQLTGAEQPPAPSEQPSSGISAAGIVAIIVIIIIVLVTPPLRGLLWLMLFSNWGGGYRGGYSSGGWGGGGFGGGGGGGFGGFGGGSTGGGGSFGSW